jgi:hypothetical protein
VAPVGASEGRILRAEATAVVVGVLAVAAMPRAALNPHQGCTGAVVQVLVAARSSYAGASTPGTLSATFAGHEPSNAFSIRNLAWVMQSAT